VADSYGCPTYSFDLARAIAALVRDKAPFGTYHLMNTGVTSWAKLAQQVFGVPRGSTAWERVAAVFYAARITIHACQASCRRCVNSY
jgi:dTDP-4-dehydrorhamnose reductase